MEAVKLEFFKASGRLIKLKKARPIGLGIFKLISVLNRTQETEGLLGCNFYNFLLFRSKTTDPRKDMIVIKWSTEQVI